MDIFLFCIFFFFITIVILNYCLFSSLLVFIITLIICCLCLHCCLFVLSVLEAPNTDKFLVCLAINTLNKHNKHLAIKLFLILILINVVSDPRFIVRKTAYSPCWQCPNKNNRINNTAILSMSMSLLFSCDSCMSCVGFRMTWLCVN